jgi:TRAP-type C4-dicarboxylate transport system permease large subunit
MFMAGVIPGLLITIGFMLICAWYGDQARLPRHRRGIQRSPTSFAQLRRSIMHLR